MALATQHTIRNSKFGNLALYDQPNNPNDTQPIYSLSRRSSQYSASLSLNEFGSIGLAYLDIYSFNGDKIACSTYHGVRVYGAIAVFMLLLAAIIHKITGHSP